MLFNCVLIAIFSACIAIGAFAYKYHWMTLGNFKMLTLDAAIIAVLVVILWLGFICSGHAPSLWENFLGGTFFTVVITQVLGPLLLIIMIVFNGVGYFAAWVFGMARAGADPIDLDTASLAPTGDWDEAKP